MRRALLAHTNTILLSSTPLPHTCLERSILGCKYTSFLFVGRRRWSWTVLHAVMTLSMSKGMTLTLCRSLMLAQFSSEKTTTVSEHGNNIHLVIGIEHACTSSCLQFKLADSRHDTTLTQSPHHGRHNPNHTSRQR